MAAHDLTEMVDVSGAAPVPGSKRTNEAWGFFIGNSYGVLPRVAATKMVVHMLRYALGVEAREARWWERRCIPWPPN